MFKPLTRFQCSYVFLALQISPNFFSTCRESALQFVKSKQYQSKGCNFPNCNKNYLLNQKNQTESFAIKFDGSYIFMAMKRIFYGWESFPSSWNKRCILALSSEFELYIQNFFHQTGEKFRMSYFVVFFN